MRPDKPVFCVESRELLDVVLIGRSRRGVDPGVDVRWKGLGTLGFCRGGSPELKPLEPTSDVEREILRMLVVCISLH